MAPNREERRSLWASARQSCTPDAAHSIWPCSRWPAYACAAANEGRSVKSLLLSGRLGRGIEENLDDLAPYDAANSCRAHPLVKEANQHHPHSMRQG
jgi:hypothetical protein